MVSNTNDTNTTTETPTAMGRLLDVSPLGGEIIDRGPMPVTLKPVFDRTDWESVAATLTIGEGLGKRDITLNPSELLKLSERLNYLTETILDASFKRAEKAVEAKAGEWHGVVRRRRIHRPTRPNGTRRTAVPRDLLRHGTGRHTPACRAHHQDRPARHAKRNQPGTQTRQGGGMTWHIYVSTYPSNRPHPAKTARFQRFQTTERCNRAVFKCTETGRSSHAPGGCRHRMSDFRVPFRGRSPAVFDPGLRRMRDF